MPGRVRARRLTVPWRMTHNGLVSMRAGLLPLILCSAAAVAAFTACCGGDSSPAAVAPADVIAFGAREADADDRYGLYLVHPDGSDPRRLAEEDGFIFSPRWSPGGDKIAYVVGAESGEQAGDLRVYDFETEATTTVSRQALPSLSGPAFSWAPDGQRLALTEAAEGGAIRIFDLDRGEPVDTPEIQGRAPEWSPDGNEIAFIRPAGSSSEAGLYLMESDGDDQRLLLEQAGLDGNPRWSPDGQRLALSAPRAEEPDERRLLIVDRDDGRATELAAGLAAAWSPDGRWLAYAGPTATGTSTDLDIFVVAADGGEPSTLGGGVTLDGWPSWSPAGDRVVYLAQADRQTAFLCIVEIEQRSSDCLDLPADLVPAAPAWSPR